MRTNTVHEDYIMLGDLRVDVPAGYHIKKAQDLIAGEEVFILGTHEGKARLYGPHKVHIVENRELINSKNVVFKEQFDCLVVKDSE